MPNQACIPNVEWLCPIGPLAAEAGAVVDKKAFFIEGIKKRFGASRPSAAAVVAVADWMELMFASGAGDENTVPADILDGPATAISKKVAKWAKSCNQTAFMHSVVVRDGFLRLRWEVPRGLIKGICRLDKAHMRKMKPTGNYDA